MGIVQIRPGSGSFIAGGPPAFGTTALRFKAALHGFTRDQMLQARQVLEVAVAGLAAQHATSEDMIAVSDEATMNGSTPISTSRIGVEALLLV